MSKQTFYLIQGDDVYEEDTTDSEKANKLYETLIEENKKTNLFDSVRLVKMETLKSELFLEESE